VDAFYFSVTTLTTVGLGDLASTTTFITTLAKETFASGRRRGSDGEGQESARGS
jgi:hypothetical protein